jgi:hypothetical protein
MLISAGKFGEKKNMGPGTNKNKKKKLVEDSQKRPTLDGVLYKVRTST